MYYKISLKNPCSQSWDKMTPQKDGRFCGACDKTVKDFTTWNNAKIVEYLLNHPETCGRYREDSLNRPVYYIPGRKTQPVIKRWLLIASIPLFMQAAYSQNTTVNNHLPPTEQYSVREMPEVATLTGNGEPVTLLITAGKESTPAANALVQVYRNHILIFHGIADTSGKMVITRDLQSADEIRITCEEVYQNTYTYAAIQRHRTPAGNTYSLCAYDRKNPPPKEETGVILGRAGITVFVDGIKVRNKNTLQPTEITVQPFNFPVIPEGHKPAEFE